MRVLVTGGTGFLGKAVALRLRDAGHTVSALGRNEAAGQQLKDAGIEFIKADLVDADKVIAACRDQEQVIHSGALAAPWGKYSTFFESNVVGTKNLLAGCQKHNVSRLVNISTPSVYFDYRHRKNIKEAYPLPNRQYTHYAATKLLADMEVKKAFEAGLPTVSIRPRAIFGPGDQTVLGRVMKLIEKGTVTLVDRGRSYVDMTYVDNVVDAIVTCMSVQKPALGKTYNITNGEPCSTRQMLDRLLAKLRMTVRYRSVPFGVAYSTAIASEVFYKILRNGQEPPITRYTIGLMSRSQTLDIAAAQRDLNYAPKIKLDDGLARYAQWWLQQQKETAKV